MRRRDLMQAAPLSVLAGLAASSPALSTPAQAASRKPAKAPAAAPAKPVAPDPLEAGRADRAYMVQLLTRMALPVLEAMAQGQLRARFPVEVSPIWDGRNKAVTYMEAFGRLIAGLAPWLALPDDATEESQLRARLRTLAQQAYVHSVDPASPDYLLWRSEGQPLVDSAYFTNALMRAPKALWEPLDATTKARIVEEIKGLRRVTPAYTNWLLFAAMNEAFLLTINEQADPMRLLTAVRKVQEWYVGDGWVSDGEQFHFDYYNSFVIHPMMLEILEVLKDRPTTFRSINAVTAYPQQLVRIQRYCEHLERLISPEGTFPPFGRSVTYRTAAFQPLALLAWRKQLPASLPEGQVRSALVAVHRAIFRHESNFTPDGFLRIGFAGHQPGLADRYSNNGSMYLTSLGLLALGLPAQDSFWTAPPQAWTGKKAWANEAFPRDYYITQ